MEGKLKQWLEESTIPFTYEEDKFSYYLEKTYMPDFKLGNTYIELKGRFTTEDRTKLLAVKKSHPELDLRILFQRNQPIRKGSSTYNSDWATKHGFKYAILDDEKHPRIPNEWLKELTCTPTGRTSRKKYGNTNMLKMPRGKGRNRVSYQKRQRS